MTLLSETDGGQNRGATALPSGSRPTDQALLHGPDASRFDPSRMGGSSAENYDPEYEASIMLPRLEAVQRDFICRMRATKSSQRITKRDFDVVYPGVETGLEWPWQLWFGGTRAIFPAGRSPIGKRRSSYSFMFNDAGLLLRAAIATEARRAETPKSGSVHEGAGPKDIAQNIAQDIGGPSQ